MNGLIFVRQWVSLLTLVAAGFAVHAQDIPLGTWRMHVAYNTITDISLASDAVYAAAPNGILRIDKTDNSITTLNRLSGLSGSDIRAIAWDEARDQLIIAYADGIIDIVTNNIVTSFDRLKNSATISGSKQLNDIVLRGALAYIASDFGVVVFDLERKEVKETWRDLGEAGDPLRITQSVFFNDSIFLATENGVIAGDLRKNLLDYNQWQRYDEGDFNQRVQSVTSFNGFVYAAISGAGVYKYANHDWTKEPYLDGAGLSMLDGSSLHLNIATTSEVWQLSTTDVLTVLSGDAIAQPRVVREEGASSLWIGDNDNGLLQSTGTSIIPVSVNGPSQSFTPNLRYASGKLYALAGGPSDSFLAKGNRGDINAFENGRWTSTRSEMADLTDIVVADGRTIVSSFGYGIEVTDATGNTIRYDENNSPLENINAPERFVNVTGVAASDEGVWVLNYGSAQPLKLLKSNNTWESFSFDGTPSRYPTEIVVDTYGSVWMVLNPAQGGGIRVFNRAQNKSVYLRDVASLGGLPSNAVYSIAVDRDGYVWVGTDLGVAYFIDTYDIFSLDNDAIRPIVDSRYLLREDRVTAIAVDGGNRKWMGTERGAWLFGPAGENAVYNFTAANSILPADTISDIAINSASGEVFIATTSGLVSYRADATASEASFQTVKIFPNPVVPMFTGMVGINGLATDAVVKITDVSGKLIWQTKANGGTATWNRQDYNGRRAASGVYLVFASTADGTESVVGKIVVVE